MASNIAVLAHDQVWFWCYLQNWLFTVQGQWPEVNYLNHFWSLAVEEQFYLVWPFVVGWLATRRLAWLCWACVVGALAARVGLWVAGAPSVALYVTTLTRLDSLCLGALFAIGLRSELWYARLTRWAIPAAALTAVSIVGIDVVWPILKTQTAGAQTIGHSLLGILFGCGVFAAAAVRPESIPGRILAQRWLTLPGQFSYAMYVMHRPVYKLVQKLDWSLVPEGAQPWAIFAATLAASIAIAALSWKFFEQPFLALKAWFPRPDAAPAAPTAPGKTGGELGVA